MGTLDDEPEPILRRLEEALRLIKIHDRLRYERLTRDLKRVWAVPTPEPIASFDHRLHACKLNTRFILAESSTPELIATTIVHEATHARLWFCDIGYEEELRARVEAVCIRRELAFASKLPNGQRVREWAERTLALCSDQAYWTNAAVDKRDLERRIEALRLLGFPNWIVRTMLTLRPLFMGAGRLVRGVTRR